MKKIILLFLLSFAMMNVSAQKEMSIKEDSIGNTISGKADENEGLIIIRSPYELSFTAITKEKDKPAKPDSIGKEGELTRYYLIFSTLPKYKDRVLRIACKGYKTIEFPIVLSAYQAKSYYVWDRKGTVGVSTMDKSINEGTELFKQGQYDQAKDKLLDALDYMEASNGSTADQEFIASLLDKTSLCAEAKESAENLFNRQEWLEAKAKYQEVININKDDRHCFLRVGECQLNYDETPRVITGTVKKNGSLIAGAVVMAVEYDHKGKEKKPDKATRTTTDSSGRYEITVQNKTKALKCWEGMTRVKTIRITDNTINISL